jgi:hypothetical protein
MKIRDLEMSHELAQREMAAVRGGHDDEVCTCLPPQQPGLPSLPSPTLPDMSAVERSLEQLREAVGSLYPREVSSDV